VSSSTSRGARTHVTHALLLRRVDYGESDLVLSLFTAELGRISALARGARRSRRRFGGVLEPMHTLEVAFDERASSELFILREAKIVRPRSGVLSSLDRLDAAGRALGWIRRAAPPKTAEPALWAALESLLDRLADTADPAPRLRLAESGLSLLAGFGWAIDLERCVRCGRAAAAGQTASVDPARGGLVCRNCGGARLRLAGEVRDRLLRAARGDTAALVEADAAVALEIVDQAMRAHAGLD
jgi:DNA repair protein RecO (recombination protein O)